MYEHVTGPLKEWMQSLLPVEEVASMQDGITTYSLSAIVGGTWDGDYPSIDAAKAEGSPTPHPDIKEGHLPLDEATVTDILLHMMKENIARKTVGGTKLIVRKWPDLSYISGHPDGTPRLKLTTRFAVQ